MLTDTAEMILHRLHDLDEELASALDHLSKNFYGHQRVPGRSQQVRGVEVSRGAVSGVEEGLLLRSGSK